MWCGDPRATAEGTLGILGRSLLGLAVLCKVLVSLQQ